MFAFNRNNDKLREEVILIGRMGYNSSNIQNHEVFTSKYAKMIMKTFLFRYWIRQGK